MGELAIRRERTFSVPRFVQPEKTEKTAGSSSSQKAAGRTGLIVSDALQRLMAQAGRAENEARGSRRTLQSGEGVLAEVRDHMDRIKELAREAAGDGKVDRAALQEELEHLRSDIDRMLGSAAADGAHLFLDEDAGVEEGLDALLQTILEDLSADPEGIRDLPDWFLRGLAGEGLSAEQMLAELDLDQTASGAELLAAIANSAPEDSAAARLAVLYLGAAIAGGGEDVSPEELLEGLRQILERIAGGTSPDAALKDLTGGLFSSLMDLQAQLASGTAPGLQELLAKLLLTDSGVLAMTGPSLLALLAGTKGMDPDLLMDIFSTLPSSMAESSQAGPEAGAGQAAGSGGTETEGTAPSVQPRMAVLQAGGLQVMGRDLSGVSFRADTGTLAIGGTADVMLLGAGQDVKKILISGSGQVTLQNMKTAVLTVDAPSARIASAARNTVGQLQLREGVTLTLDGRGQIRLDGLKAGPSSALRLAGGAVVLPGKKEGALEEVRIPVVVDGPVSLAARAASVTTPDGRSAEPLDIVWKALLPGWSSISSMEVNGKQVRMDLGFPDAARLWLDKGDPSHGYPAYALVVRGRDELGQLMSRYAYLRWDQRRGLFQELVMYPDPFTVTGGEPGKDWVYEEPTQTLHILSDQVTGLAGGIGLDAEQVPFSGRIALADQIGKTELALGGTVCQVSYGRAFDLGCGNDVTLILGSGTRNRFESGPGCAGISLGNGTSLSIDCVRDPDGKEPDGSLTASGGDGGAGIGRDSGNGQDQASHILIRGGTISAAGTGGGAGIGAGKGGAIGSITVLGGSLSAQAGHAAAAIGAGVQGACGDILIAGTAKIVKAVGGNPGVDIGACLFGACGKVSVSAGADIGEAKLWSNTGIPLRIGEDTVMLPRFRLSSKVLRLDQMDMSTRQSARKAERAAGAGRRWIGQIQAVYGALRDQLDEELRAIRGAQPYIGAAENALRDTIAASDLLRDMEQSIQLRAAQAVSAHGRKGAGDVKQLLW